MKTGFWRRAAMTVAIAPLGFVWHGQASAQSTGAEETIWSGTFGNGVSSGIANDYDRGQNMSVRERPRPDYEAMGIHAGGFMIYPKMTVSLTYDDNIFALPSHSTNGLPITLPDGANVSHPVGDTIISAAPEIDFQSTWSRNSLAGYARLQQDQNFHYDAESATQYGAGLNGKYEFGESALFGGVDYGHYVEPRSAANGAFEAMHRIGFDLTELNAQLEHVFNRLKLSGRADYQIFTFGNGVSETGATVFVKDQNRADSTFTGKAEYALSPDTAVFVVGDYNKHDYDLNPPAVLINRNSHGYELDGGANFDITHLIRGQVQLGYLDQSFDGPFKDLTGLSALGKVEWFPTGLDTVTATISRNLADSGIIGSAAYLTTNASLQLDHELRRNVILTANLLYNEDDYQGIDRTDTIWGAGVSADYLLTRRVGLEASYLFTDQKSKGAIATVGPNYQDNRVTLSTILQF